MHQTNCNSQPFSLGLFFNVRQLEPDRLGKVVARVLSRAMGVRNTDSYYSKLRDGPRHNFYADVRCTRVDGQ